MGRKQEGCSGWISAGPLWRDKAEKRTILPRLLATRCGSCVSLRWSWEVQYHRSYCMRPIESLTIGQNRLHSAHDLRGVELPFRCCCMWYSISTEGFHRILAW